MWKASPKNWRKKSTVRCIESGLHVLTCKVSAWPTVPFLWLLPWLLLLSSCAGPQPAPSQPAVQLPGRAGWSASAASAPAAGPATSVDALPPRGAVPAVGAPSTKPTDRAQLAGNVETPRRAPRYVKLAPPATPHNIAELRLQFATRLVAAHPDTSYMERAPDRLSAIPVLEVELNANGSVRRITVLRKPTTGLEATALAIAAVERAAPYGDVSRLPKPWKVVETFLFDDDMRFKPRTLDMD